MKHIYLNNTINLHEQLLMSAINNNCGDAGDTAKHENKYKKENLINTIKI